ncbi:patatin-like phospholipase family protein [Gracilimonas mengyeensis]|uniref:Patatin-like phospholipase n=1 Tax=Gracilimonas mengyeensis TaxID=1302730 RepID=A0A521DTX0_9BACT|nr:patatin-like phospholipase family protein [Gracilimonas mengyeensis]SMO74280.1 Patatin-like phospholipase [Gracilimonas mengyeensis]
MAIRKVLSISGGGIRGIIPTMVLSEIEEKTGKSTSKLFDLIAGTSTGGILALALTCPDSEGQPRYTAEELIGLYRQKGPDIFNRSKWYKVKTMGSLFDAKYPADGIEEVLKTYFRDSAEDAIMLREALTPLLITSYDIEMRSPWFFRSEKAKQDPEYDFPMEIAARATSAAPTYFDPVKVKSTDGMDYYSLVDGGVFANNPAMCAYVEAKNLFPEDDILVVSLGTGELTRRIPHEEAIEWGLAQWAKPVLDVVFDGITDTTNYQLQSILPEDRFFKFQIRLTEGNDDMDDTSNTNLRVLQLLAKQMIQKEQSKLQELVDML